MDMGHFSYGGGCNTGGSGLTGGASDFVDGMNFDMLSGGGGIGAGVEEGSLTSLLLGTDTDDMMGGADPFGMKRGNKTDGGGGGGRVGLGGYLHSPAMQYGGGMMGGYPYSPYVPYGMAPPPQGGYYPPPHPSHSLGASVSSAQGSSSGLGGYMPMPYLPNAHLGMHPGYMQSPGLMSPYDMNPGAGGRFVKNDFEKKSGE